MIRIFKEHCIIFDQSANLNTFKFVSVFAKADLMGTNTETHFLPVDESHTNALSRDAMHLRLDGQVYFYRWLF